MADEMPPDVQEAMNRVAKHFATRPAPEREVENPIARLSGLRAGRSTPDADEGIPLPYPTDIRVDGDGMTGTFEVDDEVAEILRNGWLVDPTPLPNPIPDAEGMRFVHPPLPPESKSMLSPGDPAWRDMMFKPGMAAAMMFLLSEVINRAVDGKYSSLTDLIDDLSVWDSLTVVESVALTELFAWVENEVTQGDESLIPPPIRMNVVRAYENYAAGS